MTRPNSGMKITKKDGITFQSNVDHVKFSIEELIHAANRDVGRFLRREITAKLHELHKPTFVKGRKEISRAKKLAKQHINNAIKYWAGRRDLDLQIGYTPYHGKKNNHWIKYGELGEFNYPKHGLLRNTVYENISQINTIQGQYLTELNKEKPNSNTGSSEIGEGESV